MQGFINPVDYLITTKGIFTIREEPTALYYVIFLNPYMGTLTAYDALDASGLLSCILRGTKNKPLKGMYQIGIFHKRGLTVKTTQKCSVFVGSQPTNR